MTRILSVSSGRADVGILSPIWRAIVRQGELELEVMLTGMHMAAPRETLDAVRAAVPSGVPVHVGGEDLGGGDGADAAAAMAAITRAAGSVYEAARPDAVMVIGDRLDMIPAAVASLPFNIPLVHLAGGDLSEGAIDDRIRHALTKLSHVHCTLNAEAADRIARMGEEPWRIHVTGASGLDSLAAARRMTPEEFAAKVGLTTTEGLRLVTVHPETNSQRPQAPLDAVLAALDADPAPTLFTAPNSDPEGRIMRARIEEFAAGRTWAVFHDTLGGELYANAMRHATVMVGNSSSGIVEAGLFGLEVINVGHRQDGRLRGPNVHDCENDGAEVARLLSRLRTPATGEPTHSLYGDGRASRRIAEILADLPPRARLLRKAFSTETPKFSAPWAR